MNKFKNENSLDRLLRIFLSEILLLLAFFWVGGVWQIIFYILGAILLFTAVTGFCAIYKIFKINTFKQFIKPLNKKLIYSIVVILIALPLAGSYYSNFFTKKIFLEDYNRMNNYYKQTLFYTGQNKKTESADNYEKLAIEYKKFNDKYLSYHPYVIKNDANFNNDLIIVSEKVINAKDKIYNGDLTLLHKDLEEIRPIFQDILKRNGFSMLAVSLVDFHDAMEKIITAADNKNSQEVIAVYDEVSDKLKAVEEVAADDEIKAIRSNLDALLDLANNNKSEELSKKAAELKSSFIKVYLVRG
ncbi:MAG: DUF2892 domain-containing protein [Candidatus Falkowbacteria bacterium]|nr:DUF2892 domain-containing protein [Candidatus Falkowbacteria bacterium]